MPDLHRARFHDDWIRLTGGEGSRALIAFSGGPDSTALLILAQATLGESVHAAIVDHGLRPESAQEAEQAAALCRALEVPHATLRAELTDGANLQARARAARYALLGAHADAIGARWIVTAHHADDQLETMVMRLNRGAGVAGLSGIRAVESRIVRPLLGWRRAELAEVVAAAGVTAVTDPSNTDDRFDRARLRKRLAAVDWIDPRAAAASAAALQDAEAALVWVTNNLEVERIVRAPHEIALDASGLPHELRRRLVLRCFAHIDFTPPRGEALTRFIAALDAGEQAMLGDVLGNAKGTIWTFRRAPPRRDG